MRILLSISAQLKLKNTLVLHAQTAVPKYGIKRGATFGISIKSGNLFIHSHREDAVGIEITRTAAKSILKSHRRQHVQSLTLKNAWELASAIYFPDMRLPSLKKKTSARDGVVGYWDQKNRVLALDLNIEDWFGDLLHEMCHQHLEDTKGLVMRNAHDSRFTKLANSVGAKIYDLSGEVEKQRIKSGKTRKKLPSNWSRKKTPEFITTFDEGKMYVGAVLAYDKNNVLYIKCPDINGFLAIAPAGQFEAQDEDIAYMKKKLGPQYKKVIETYRHKIQAASK